MFHQPSTLAGALDTIETALDSLIDVVDGDELASLDAEQTVRFMTRIEQLRSRIGVIDNAIVNDCELRDLANTHKDRGTAGFLARVLRISTGEAHRRVATAHALTPRPALSGAPVPPVRPHLAAAHRTGSVSTEQTTVIIRTLHGLDRVNGIDPSTLDAAESTLVRYAAAFGPSDLTRLGRRLTEALFPDGTLGRDHIIRDRRYLPLEPHHDGGAAIHGRLTAAAYAALYAVLTPLAAPGMTTGATAQSAEEGSTSVSDDGDATTAERACVAGGGHGGVHRSDADRRTAGQRWHDALEALCGRLLRSGTLPDSGGIPCTVVVTTTMQELQSGKGHGTLSSGAPISIPELLRLGTEAQIVPVVMNEAGGILAYGRTRRIFTPGQTTALIARDHGCSFPTCTVPPQWCQRHHVLPWVDGGKTDLSNATLACDYHHHQALGDGWDCIITAHGLPAWLPPPWVDPNRTPQINPRIIDAQLR